MELLQYFSYPLYLAQAAFTIWMLVDAYRRGTDTFWFFVILFVPGIGPWVYFFAIKIHDWQSFRDAAIWQSLWQRRPSLDELRYRAEQMPTLTHRLALAERLVERHEHDEAAPHLTAVLNQEPDLCPALYALALCQIAQGQPEQAEPLLQKIIARERTWSNYAAWHRLIQVQAAHGEGGKALATCRDLARLAPTLQHRCMLAECLLEEGRNDEARDLLERALEEHQFAPGYIRRRNRSWASRARQLQKQVPAS
jgi:hypothetical protein